MDAYTIPTGPSSGSPTGKPSGDWATYTNPYSQAPTTIWYTNTLPKTTGVGNDTVIPTTSSPKNSDSKDPAWLGPKPQDNNPQQGSPQNDSTAWLGPKPQDNSQDDTAKWPGYQDNYPQYVNPLGNDAQVNAINEYYNQMENAITSWAKQAEAALKANAEQLATTPGAMEAAITAIKSQLSSAITQLKTNVDSAAQQVINNPTPDNSSGTPGSSLPGSSIPGLNLPDLNLPDLNIPGITKTDSDAQVPDTPAGDPTELGSNPPAPYSLPEMPGPNPERVDHVSTEPLQQMLQQITDSQKEQSENKINYTVQQGINELNRAMEDAAKNYQIQRNQVAADEATALDNQALYSEARGDRGGIGEAQYASIQNTAAQNRRAVNDAQVKLGTDTARQVADLRAQGEFEKADQLLSITQSYMSQLANLEQWAMGTNVGVDEFNSQLQQWVDEYNLDKQKFLSDLDLSAAQLTGMFSDGTKTFEAQQALITSLANSGNALLQMGIMPSQQQLQAMGMTASQAQQYVAKKTSPLGQLGLI